MPAKKAASRASSAPSFTVPGMSLEEGSTVAAVLQDRLDALQDLHLTLKHVHWNVVGPHFIGVHQMLDPQVDAVRLMADQAAERIAALGQSPAGTPGGLVGRRSWDDYSVGRAGAIEHLGALDLVYQGVISDHRDAVDEVSEPDPTSEDMLIEHLRQLEIFHWFVRAHLEGAGGELSTSGADTEQAAAKKAGARARRTA